VSLEPYNLVAEVAAYKTAEIPALSCPVPSLADIFSNVPQMTENLKGSAVEPYKEAVESPDHYTAGGIETIDYMRAKMSHEGFCGFLLGNVLKYVSRAGHKKNELEDLKKAQWYLNKLIEEKGGK
jgi:hypothetical protein